MISETHSKHFLPHQKSRGNWTESGSTLVPAENLISFNVCFELKLFAILFWQLQFDEQNSNDVIYDLKMKNESIISFRFYRIIFNLSSKPFDGNSKLSSNVFESRWSLAIENALEKTIKLNVYCIQQFNWCALEMQVFVIWI